MISENDMRRINAGADLAAKWYATPVLLFGAAVFLSGSVAHGILAIRYAHFEGLSFHELLSAWGGKVELSREYSGAIVRARDALSTAFWEVFVGLYVLLAAYNIKSRGKLYERLREQLNVGNT